MKSSNKIPFGVVTISLVLVAVVLQVWPKKQCEMLTNSLESGYFLRWAEPQLLLIRADKKTFTVNHENKEGACSVLLQQLAQ